VTRILITGAAGFLGAALAARLRADGDEVVGIDRVADPAHGVEAGDTTSPEPWVRHLAGCNAVLHTAAVVSNAVDLAEQWRVNVLDAARVRGRSRCRRAASSCCRRQGVFRRRLSGRRHRGAPGPSRRQPVRRHEDRVRARRQWPWYVPDTLQDAHVERFGRLHGSVELGIGVALVWTPGHTDGNHSLV
jgi:hypothetical protein